MLVCVMVMYVVSVELAGFFPLLPRGWSRVRVRVNTEFFGVVGEKVDEDLHGR